MQERDRTTDVVYAVLAWGVVLLFGVAGVVLDMLDDEPPAYVPEEDGW